MRLTTIVATFSLLALAACGPAEQQSPSSAGVRVELSTAETTGGTTQLSAGQTTIITADLTGTPGQALSYTWSLPGCGGAVLGESSPPSPVVLDAAGTARVAIAFTAPASAGSCTVQLAVQGGSASAQGGLQASVVEVADRPVITFATATPSVVSSADRLVDVYVAAQGRYATSALRYEGRVEPAEGSLVQLGYGRFQWTPPAAAPASCSGATPAPGSYAIVVRVVDSGTPAGIESATAVRLPVTYSCP